MAAKWGDAMNAQATKLEGAENDLKQLMADITQAIEKAQEAVARIAPKTATPMTEAESMSSSRQNSSS
jgi:t-SNARE complex subunit (syntaxin)